MAPILLSVVLPRITLYAEGMSTIINSVITEVVLGLGSEVHLHSHVPFGLQRISRESP